MTSLLPPRPPEYDISTQNAMQITTRRILANARVYQDAAGTKVFFLINSDTNIVKKSSEEGLTDLVAQVLNESEIILSQQAIVGQIRTWAMTAPRLDKFPPSFSTSLDEITFLRINLEQLLNSNIPTPTWDSFLARCGANADALKAFTWSLFEQGDMYHDQYLFLKGPGGDGKGSYIRFLCRLFENNSGSDSAYAALSTEDDRWVAQCVGKRLGTFNDINNTSIVMTTAFKNVTGRDPVTINQKYEKSYSTTLDTKFVLTTNKRISIGGDRSEQRRAIIINMQALVESVPNYEKKLWQEAGGFLAKCKEAFEQLYDKDSKIIKCDYEDFNLEKEEFEEFSIYLLEEFFVLDVNGEVACNAFYNAIKDELRGKYLVKDFKNYLFRDCGVKRLQGTDGKRMYRGIKLKGASSHNTKSIEALKHGPIKNK